LPEGAGNEAMTETGKGRAPEAVVPGKTVIEPPGGWRMLDLRELWAYRELLAVLVTRDIKVRYKQSVLGVAWVILRPLLSAGIFTLVFGLLVKIPSEGRPYAIFVFTALLPWTFFSVAVASSCGSLVGSAGLIGKVYFPRLLIPLASVAGGLLDLAISIGVLLVLMPFFGVEWSFRLLLVPFLVAGVFVAALGVGTLLSALTVAYRDFGNLVGFLLQLWMFATPVVYPASLVPERFQWVFHFNPMAAQVEGFRSAFLGTPADPAALAVSTAASVLILLAGVAYFEKVERRFADII
jgi:lipopolysaccharide transport system permease protein